MASGHGRLVYGFILAFVNEQFPPSRESTRFVAVRGRGSSPITARSETHGFDLEQSVVDAACGWSSFSNRPTAALSGRGDDRLPVPALREAAGTRKAARGYAATVG
jgi:hypothetical protein